MTRYRIKDLPEQERPRERMEAHGPKSLSNSELLAIILRTGTADSTAVELAALMLSHFGSLKKLAEAEIADITVIKGIGPAKACQIIAAFELGRRAAALSESKLPTIQSPDDIVSLVKNKFESSKQEELLVALLNSKLQAMKVVQVSKGTLTASLIHPRETFRAAIKEGCHSVIIVHNHPSGDPEPSAEDIKITRKLVSAGELLGIKVIDHIIIAGDSFKSLKDAGMIA